MNCNNASLALEGLIKVPRSALEFAITVTVRLLLKYSKSVSDRMKELKSELGIDLHSRFVAVHIRSGMFASGVNESHVIPHLKSDNELEWEIECAMNKSKALGVTAPIVVISDSMLRKQWAKKRYGNRVAISSIAPLHIAKDTNSWTDRAKVKKKMKRYQSVLASTAELALLSDATAVVMAASGFSRISTWLGGFSIDDKICCHAECDSTFKLVYP